MLLGLHHPSTITSANPFAMAEASSSGIDRKADERMEFSTSKEVTVHPTFESMSLKGTRLPPIDRFLVDL